MQRRTITRRARGDSGDTLIELVIALVVLGIAGVAIMVALETAIMGSASYRSVATMDTMLKSAANLVTSQIQSPTSDAFTCPTTAYHPSVTLPTPSYVVSDYSLKYWTGSAVVTPPCSKAGEPLFVTLTVTGHGSTRHISFIVDDPQGQTIPSTTTAVGLTFITLPVHASIGTPFSPAVAVEIVGPAGHPVTGDISQMSLTLASGDPTGAVLSPSCFGVEVYGVYTFSNCSVNKSGSYELVATDATHHLTKTSRPFFVGIRPSVSVSDTVNTLTHTLSFTATVTGSTTLPLTGSPTWTVTPPGGGSLPCSSQTSGTQPATSVVYACTIATASPGVYTASAAWSPSPSTTHYEPATGYDGLAIVPGPPQTSSITLEPVTTPIQYGGETREVFFGYVTGKTGDGYPEGTVTVKTGSTTLCTTTLGVGSGDRATFACPHLTAKKLTPTNYLVTAQYTGGRSSTPAFTYKTSSTLSNDTSRTLTVGKGLESTSISLNTPSSTSYGLETSEGFTGRVTGQPNDGYPKGTVTIKTGSTTLCTTTLGTGTSDYVTFRCTVTNPTLLTPGAYPLSVTYTPSTTSSSNSDYSYKESTTTAKSLRVTGVVEPTTITLNTPSSTSYGLETSEGFTGRVTGQPNDGYPRGTVAVTTGSTTLCTMTLGTGTSDYVTFRCTITKATVLTPGTYKLTATYTPSATSSSNINYSYTGSTTSAKVLTVTKAGTKTSVVKTTPSGAPVTGQSITFTATVAMSTSGPETPTGTVTFSYKPSGGATYTTLCSNVTLNNSSASCTTTALVHSGSPYTVKATYSGSNTFDGSSGTLSQGVTKAKTTTTVTKTSPTGNPVTGQSVTFKATVVATSPGSGTPTGTVTFSYEASGGHTYTVMCSNVTLTSGSATCTTTALARSGSPYTIKVTYSGSTTFTASTGTLSQSVTKPKTTTTVTKTSPTGNPVTGQSVTFKATVAPSNGTGTPTGTVTFSYEASGGHTYTAICSGVTLTSGSATCTTTALVHSGSPYTIKVTYSGSTTFTASTGTLSQSVTKAKTTTTVTKTSPTGNPVSGQSVTFKATVAATSPGSGTPTGTVTFSYEASGGHTYTAICSGVTLASGSATCTTTALAHSGSPYTIKVTYAGSTTFTASTGTLSQSVTKAKTTTTVTKTSPTGNPVTGQSVTFKATVAATSPGSGTPAGTVTFSYEASGGSTYTTICSNVTLTSGSATCATTALVHSGSPYTIKVTYSGSTTFTASTGTLSQSVTKAKTTTTVTKTSPTGTPGTHVTVTFRATVAATSPGSGTPAGTVTFSYEASGGHTYTAMCSGATLTAGSASCTTKVLVRTGSPYTIKVTYSGSTTFTASTGTLSQRVT